MRKKLHKAVMAITISCVLLGMVQLASAKGFMVPNGLMKKTHNSLPDSKIMIGSDITIPEGKSLNGDVVCMFGNVIPERQSPGQLDIHVRKIKLGDKGSCDGDTVLLYSKVDPKFKPGKSIVEINIFRNFLIKAAHFWLKALVFNLILDCGPFLSLHSGFSSDISFPRSISKP